MLCGLQPARLPSESRFSKDAGHAVFLGSLPENRPAAAPPECPRPPTPSAASATLPSRQERHEMARDNVTSNTFSARELLEEKPAGSVIWMGSTLTWRSHKPVVSIGGQTAPGIRLRAAIREDSPGSARPVRAAGRTRGGSRPNRSGEHIEHARRVLGPIIHDLAMSRVTLRVHRSCCSLIVRR